MEFFDEKYDFSKIIISNNAIVGLNKETITFPNDTFDSYPLDVKVRRVVGVLWSGGFDSTLLLLKHLNRGETVLPVVFDFNNNESIPRHIIYNQLKLVFGDKLLFPYTYNIDHFKNGVYETNGRSQQILIHFYLGLMQDEILKRINCFEIGYINKGISLRNKKDYLKIYSGSMKQQHGFCKKIVYPFKKKDKDYIFKEFDKLCKKYNLHLPCMSCYNPNISYSISNGKFIVDIDSCKECRSCERNIKTSLPRELSFHMEIPAKEV